MFVKLYNKEKQNKNKTKQRKKNKEERYIFDKTTSIQIISDDTQLYRLN
jgi:TFIIF-interacting CTD phosphatase-like protein